MDVKENGEKYQRDFRDVCDVEDADSENCDSAEMSKEFDKEISTLIKEKYFDDKNDFNGSFSSRSTEVVDVGINIDETTNTDQDSDVSEESSDFDVSIYMQTHGQIDEIKHELQVEVAHVSSDTDEDVFKDCNRINSIQTSADCETMLDDVDGAVYFSLGLNYDSVRDSVFDNNHSKSQFFPHISFVSGKPNRKSSNTYNGSESENVDYDVPDSGDTLKLLGEDEHYSSTDSRYFFPKVRFSSGGPKACEKNGRKVSDDIKGKIRRFSDAIQRKQYESFTHVLQEINDLGKVYIFIFYKSIYSLLVYCIQPFYLSVRLCVIKFSPELKFQRIKVSCFRLHT